MAPVVERVLLDLDGVTEELVAAGDAARQTSAHRGHAAGVVAPAAAGLLAMFRESHPQVKVRLLDAGLEDVEKAVLADEADLGLGFFFKAAAGADA